MPTAVLPVSVTRPTLGSDVAAVLALAAQELEAIAIRHVQVEQDEREIAVMRLELLEALETIARLDDIELVLEQRAQDLAIDVVILDDEHKSPRTMYRI